MHIERILLRDVGPFDDVTIDLPKGTDPDLADVFLLTGPNGSGKSTVLYALAAVIARGYRDLGSDLLVQRMRSKNALVAFSAEGHTFGVAPVSREGWVEDPFGGPPLGATEEGGGLRYVRAPEHHFRYAEQAADYDAHRKEPSFAWAAFAYAGLRSVADVQIAAVQPPKTSPFQHSLSFVHTADTAQLASWIANQDFMRLKAKEAGNLDRAEQLARAIGEIERIIAEIIEDPSFRFVMTDEDNDVRVRWRGTTARLGVLPDGLKSIVSWIADLLMRLDRIPWHDNTPVLHRPFLLLLDEIDIHLHPAWQRKVLPFVQRAFPNAQIIASTHSPFVVGSLADGRIISLDLQGSSAKVVQETAPQLGVSYSALLRSIFGIESEFDVETERQLGELQDAKKRLFKGDQTAASRIHELAGKLAGRSEELREIVALELGQLRRQLAARATP
jgi:predicted ATP-binding protein involved in virulence